MLRPDFLTAAVANIALWFSTWGAAGTVAAQTRTAGVQPVQSALASGNLGMFPAEDFRLVEGTCTDCPAPKQALWYFSDDLVAVPKAGVGVAGHTPGLKAQEDVRRWFLTATADELQARTPLVWIGSPSVISDATLQKSGDLVGLADGSVMPFAVTPKIPSNLSYYDASTAEFFKQRALRIRGRVAQGADGKPSVVARTIWPQDFVIDDASIKLAPLGAGETLAGEVRQTANTGRYAVRLLWERNPGQPRRWANLTALGIMLNGAQGDDDEAHGGHFAIVTGRLGARGEWADWLVNNFYNLDSYSEKGIIASAVPADNYLMDLNSGQAYYRPSYLLVALMRGDRAVYAYQGAIARVFDHFYRHDMRYRHAAANCAGISMDTLRTLGWNIPARGPTSYARAVAAYPYMAVKERSFDSGRQSFDYLREEQTRLHPAVAFDAAGNDLLQLVGAQPAVARKLGAYEELLRSEVEAIVFVRIPQIPSSRVQGTFPVASIDEYMQRVPEDKAQWKIVPVEPRPFPSEFVNAGTEPEKLHNGALPVATGLIFAGALTVWGMRRRRARREDGGLIK